MDTRTSHSLRFDESSSRQSDGHTHIAKAHTALPRCILSVIRTQGPKPKYFKEQLQTPLLQYFEEILPHLNREIWAN
ncbi:hypothetical protein L1887_11003 [Cichorium endivia]|nr:hypothetical protein L1887_11003 [Cichorium endivia]